jgi:dTDP-4-amino-4,6-dideoxygalactose transaminase
MILESGNQLSATPPAFTSVENGLLQHTGGSSVAWFGRAATALHWAYRLIMRKRPDLKNPEIIMPAIMCGTPANAALLAGAVPRFADVDPNTGLMSLQTIQERVTPNTCAVVVIHLLGQTVDTRPIAEWCRQHNLILIEDLAQATGAKFPDGAYAGSVGDMIVYSFNRTKILENGNGALVLRRTQDESRLETLLHAEPLPPEIPHSTRTQLGLSYRNLHHALVALLRSGSITPTDVSHAFLTLRPAYDSLYNLPASTAPGLDAAWEQLPDNLSRRVQRAALYANRLSDGAWHLLDGWKTSGVCWRFSLLIDNPSQLVHVSEAVRKDGFHVSNLYWPANHLFHPSDVCPNAEYFARRIVNLWVDDTIDVAWIERCCDSLWHHAHLLQ